jgi:hypothetical protein
VHEPQISRLAKLGEPLSGESHSVGIARGIGLARYTDRLFHRQNMAVGIDYFKHKAPLRLSFSYENILA